MRPALLCHSLKAHSNRALGPLQVRSRRAGKQGEDACVSHERPAFVVLLAHDELLADLAIDSDEVDYAFFVYSCAALAWVVVVHSVYARRTASGRSFALSTASVACSEIISRILQQVAVRVVLEQVCVLPKMQKPFRKVCGLGSKLRPRCQTLQLWRGTNACQQALEGNDRTDYANCQKKQKEYLPYYIFKKTVSFETLGCSAGKKKTINKEHNFAALPYNHPR